VDVSVEERLKEQMPHVEVCIELEIVLLHSMCISSGLGELAPRLSLVP
jgi:hypothetical protein